MDGLTGLRSLARACKSALVSCNATERCETVLLAGANAAAEATSDRAIAAVFMVMMMVVVLSVIVVLVLDKRASCRFGQI
jgi:heme/copper-type cytochrome/quinol oxidase subunit 2